VEQVRQLQQLRGIGPESAWLYVREFFGWRQFAIGGSGSLRVSPPRLSEWGHPARVGDTQGRQSLRARLGH